VLVKGLVHFPHYACSIDQMILTIEILAEGIDSMCREHLPAISEGDRLCSVIIEIRLDDGQH
jgi:hypothetical protein